MYSENKPIRKKHKGKKIFFVVAAIIVFATVIGTVVMLLWNAIIPNIMNTRPIKLWEAIGLLAIFRLLAGGLRRGIHGPKHSAKRQAWKEKWMNMSPEEKAEFKSRWKKRCGRN